MKRSRLPSLMWVGLIKSVEEAKESRKPDLLWWELFLPDGLQTAMVALFFCRWTHTEALVLPDSWAADLQTGTTSSSLQLASSLQTLGLAHFLNHMNQFLVTSLFPIYTSYRFCFPGEPWLITLPQRYCQYPHFADECVSELGPTNPLWILTILALLTFLLSPHVMLPSGSFLVLLISFPPSSRVIYSFCSLLCQVAALSLTLPHLGQQVPRSRSYDSFAGSFTGSWTNRYSWGS